MINECFQDRESASKDMERRIVAQLLSCMDELNGKQEVEKPKPDSTSANAKEDEEEMMEIEKVRYSWYS